MAKRRQKPVDFTLPIRGVYEGNAWHSLPSGFTPSASNVLPFDSLGRQRPGKRCGTQKFFSYQFGGGATFCQHVSWCNVQDLVGGTSATKILACFGGRTYLQTPGGLINAIDGGVALFNAAKKVSAITINNATYLTDGEVVKAYDHTTGLMGDWTASAGTFPVAGGNYPRILAAWRGRAVLARLDEGVASTIFFTAQDDPTDFDYGATPPTAAMAVATDSNFRAGQLGEGVTALIPFNNDRLIVGCENSIHEFQGDPADGGTLVPVSFGVGILSDTSWCQVNGAVYFIGTGGFYRMRPGTEPELLSSFAVNNAYRDIPHQGNFLSMAYDKRRHGVWAFVSKVATPYTTRHYFYDLRAEELFGRGGFWPVSFPADTGGDIGDGTTGAPSYGPSKCCGYDGDEQTSDGRCVLLGCRDGYIRTFDDDVYNDDGTTVSAHVWLGPLQGDGASEVFVNGHRPILGEHGNDTSVTWTLKGGPDAYRAYNAPTISKPDSATPINAGGRTGSLGDRMAAAAIWLKVESAASGKTFSVERWTANVEAGGPLR